VGGVSERPTREGGRSDPFDRPPSRRWKASGLQEGGTLRGVPSERRSWSVRHVRRGSSSACGRTGDKRCSSDAEEGNDVSSRPKMREHPTRGLARPLTPRGRVLCSVRGPVHVNRGLTTAGNRSGATRSLEHRGRANLGNQEEPAPGFRRTDVARLVARHRSSQGSRVVRQKRKEVAASVPSRNRELGSKCPHVVAVAEVGRRRLAPNTLARSAPKRVAVRVNGGLARGHRRR